MKMKLLPLACSLLLTCFAINSKAQANQKLSNLTSPTSINQSLLPNASNSLDLGSNSLRWKRLYLGSYLYLKGTLSMLAPGTGNFFVGNNAGNISVTGANNTALGAYSLYSNTTGHENTAGGYYSQNSNTTGYVNTAYGWASLQFNTTGSDNTGLGGMALYANTTGWGNTAVGGWGALYSNKTGVNNTAIGYASLQSNTTGYNNTALGYLADVSGNVFNATAIGSEAIVDASNKVRIGNNYVTSIGGKVGWTTFSDSRYKMNIKENVKGLAFINSLKPITYTINIQGLNEYYNKGRKQIINDPISNNKDIALNIEMKKAEDAASKIVYNGFIAQEVEVAAKKLGYDFSGVDKPETQEGLYGLRYDNFVVPLVKAVQELSQQNDSLKSVNNKQQQQIANLQSRLDKIEALILKSQSTNIELEMPAKLKQNIPNPFNNITTINYFLPANKENAYINLYSLSGTLLKSVKLSGGGKGTINVKGNEFPSGVYQYSLVINGKVVEAKQMVRAK